MTISNVSKVRARFDILTNVPLRKGLFFLMSAFATVYALLAGLRTLTDYDLGWQLATGRWIVQHHQIPSTEFLSYTAHGQPWIYPVLSQVFFYLTYSLGGYTLLSWTGAVVCLAVTLVLLWRGSLIAPVLVVLATPLIALRAQPRADMFTLLLFAVFVSVLWRNHLCVETVPMWTLPMLMVLWVNLHLGFVSGLIAVAVYGIAESIDEVRVYNRDDPRLQRVARASIWLALTFLATLLNPWGWNIYRALIRQDEAMAFHQHWIGEWASTPISWESARNALQPGGSGGALLVLLAISAVTVAIALHRRHFSAAILLVGASCLAIRYVRFQAVFACVSVVISASLLSSAYERLRARRKLLTTIALFAFSASTATAIWRSADIVSGRKYLRGTGTSSFGAGLSWWFPEGAANFIERERIPPNLFNTYNLGGYVTWRLSPTYLDYIDGRAIPFGPELFRRQDQLTRMPPDSTEWQQESDSRGINSMLVSLARYDGLQFFPVLKQYCESDTWIPVYLDEVSAVFVRRSADTEELIRRTRVNCSTTHLPAKSLSGDITQRFNQLANAAAVLLVLGRTRESMSASEDALVIYPESANVHYIRARALASLGMQSQALEEYLTAVRLQPDEGTWAALAQMYRTQGHRAAAIDAFIHAVRLSPDPHLIYLTLAYTLLEDKRPTEAIHALDEAVRTAPSADSALASDNSFNFSVVHGRALCFYALGEIPKAVSYQEEAVRIQPQRSELWVELSTLYWLSGKKNEAQQARSHADDLLGGTSR